MNRQLRRECIDDRFRRRWWGAEYYQKPGYRRRQQKFFAKAVARREQVLRDGMILLGLA